MAAEEKEREKSLKTKLSAWDWRVAEADSVTLHPRETRRYDQRHGVMYISMCVCGQSGGCHGVAGSYTEKEAETMPNAIKKVKMATVRLKRVSFPNTPGSVVS